MDPFWPFAVVWRMKFSNGRIVTYRYVRSWFFENPVKIANRMQKAVAEGFGGGSPNLEEFGRVR